MGNKKSNKSGFGLLVGLAAGAAAGFWLNSTKGKLWRKKAMEDSEEFRNEMSEMAKEKAGEFSSTVNTYAEDIKAKTTEIADDLSSKFNQTASEVENYVVNKASTLTPETEKTSDSAKNAIKEGIEKAKSRLQSLNSDFINN